MFYHILTRSLFTMFALALSIAGSSASAQNTSGPWAGPYVGMHVGYGSGDIDWALNGNGWWGVPNPASNRTSFSPEGELLGAFLGYGWQTQNNFYWGLDASISSSDMKESQASPAFPAIDTWTVEIRNFWDVSGRFGYAQNQYLIYGTVGIAGADVESRASPPIDSSDEVHIGYSLGIGGEYMVANNTSIGLEYKYYDFGSKNHSFNPACGPCGPGDGRSIDVNAHVVNLRLSHYF